MEISIGKYTLSRRTNHSKIIVSVNGNLDFPEKTQISEKINLCFSNQTGFKDKYFGCEEKILYNYTERSDTADFVFVPDGIEIIERDVFSNCHAKYIYLPPSIKEIKRGAFYGCTMLEEIILPKDIERIGENLFENNTNLKRVILPNNITRLPAYCFYCCESLENLVLPDSIKYIGHCSLNKCKKLKKITFPKSFKSIGTGVFVYSGIDTIRFDFDLENSFDPIDCYGGFLCDSRISFVEIGKNVSHIDQELFTYARGDIKGLLYDGTKKEFKKFKKQNKMFLKTLNARIYVRDNSLEYTPIKRFLS